MLAIVEGMLVDLPPGMVVIAPSGIKYRNRRGILEIVHDHEGNTFNLGTFRHNAAVDPNENIPEIDGRIPRDIPEEPEIPTRQEFFNQAIAGRRVRINPEGVGTEAIENFAAEIEQDLAERAAVVMKKRFKAREPEKVTLTEAPIIPEVNPATMKARLGLARYKMLEKEYRELAMRYNNLIDEHAQTQVLYAEAEAKRAVLYKQYTDLKANSPDPQSIVKKMHAVAKNFGMRLDFRQMRSIEDKLNLFFGLLMAQCRPVNTEDTPDEVAE